MESRICVMWLFTFSCLMLCCLCDLQSPMNPGLFLNIKANNTGPINLEVILGIYGAKLVNRKVDVDKPLLACNLKETSQLPTMETVTKTTKTATSEIVKTSKPTKVDTLITTTTEPTEVIETSTITTFKTDETTSAGIVGTPQLTKLTETVNMTEIAPTEIVKVSKTSSATTIKIVDTGLNGIVGTTQPTKMENMIKIKPAPTNITETSTKMEAIASTMTPRTASTEIFKTSKQFSETTTKMIETTPTEIFQMSPPTKIETKTIASETAAAGTVGKTQRTSLANTDVDNFDPNGYTRIPSLNSYKFHNDLATWKKAKEICESENAHLAIINSEEERDALIDLWDKTSNNIDYMESDADLYNDYDDDETNMEFGTKYNLRYPYWYSSWVPRDEMYAFIGFSDHIVDGQYQTVLGQPLNSTGFTTWTYGQPDDLYFTEDCGSLFRPQKTLSLIYCEYERNFFCEKELHR